MIAPPTAQAHDTSQQALGRFSWAQGLLFPLTMWALSRLVIVIGLALLAPGLPSPKGEPMMPGWGMLANWDGVWYRMIVERGYDYAPDGQGHSIVFFPLYPMLIRAVMSMGLPFELAGALISNVCFLGALLLSYSWVQQRFGPTPARWTSAILAWCPYSLFGVIVYTEGLFLLLTTLSLWAFERKRHLLAGIAGALATATRINAAPLIPAMLFVAWRERRGVGAYICALVAGLGLVLFIGYCAIRFGDPMAFVKAQRAWRAGLGFDWVGWLSVVTLGRIGPMIHHGTAIAVMIAGSFGLLWMFRKQLPLIALVYSLGVLALLLMTGSLASLDRYIFGIIPLTMALGLFFSKYPRWGMLVLSYFAIMLGIFSVRFAQSLWVA